MRKKDGFQFIMTRKSLVVYIVFTVLLGLFLFFVIGDMVGKCAACIVCPMLIAYLLYAYCKESKADTKAREMKAQYMNGSYFEKPVSPCGQQAALRTPYFVYRKARGRAEDR